MPLNAPSGSNLQWDAGRGLMCLTDLRPISVFPRIAKIFDSIVGEWILTTLEPQFDPNQFGCRRGRSTTHALTAMLHAWQTTIRLGWSS